MVCRIELDLHCDEIVRSVETSVFEMFNKVFVVKFWLHQAVKYDFTADLTETGNRLEEVLKSQSFLLSRTDADIRGVSTYVLLS